MTVETWRGNESRFETLAETTSAAIFIWRGTKFCAGNAAIETMTGYSRQELTEVNVWAVIQPDKPRWVTPGGERLSGQAIPFRSEARVHTRDGSTRWIDLTAAAIDYEGEPAMLGTAIDITERKRAEAERQRLIAILEATPDFVGIADALGRPIYLNPASRRFLRIEDGAPMPEVHVSEFVEPSQRARFSDEVWPAALREGTWYGRNLLQYGDGPAVPVSQVINAHHGDDGRLEYVSTIARDVTRQEQAENALKQSEARYRTLMESANDAIFIADAHTGMLVDANQKAQTLLGRPHAEILQMHQSELHPVQQRPHYRAVFERQVAAGTGVATECEVEHRDGRRIPVEISCSVMEIGGRRLIQGIFRDLTERKRVKAQLREREAELAHMSRVSTMGEIAAAIAHEINQPLFAVTNYVSGCRNMLARGTLDKAKLTEALDEMNNQLRRAATIIQRLKTYISKTTPKRSPEDMNQLLLEVQQLLPNHSETSPLDILTQLEPQMPAVCMDRIQIQQVMVNLLRNALEAMSDVDAPQKRVVVRTEVRDNEVIVSFRDHGSGVSPEKIEQIFEPYYTTKPEGMGMGLSICRTIVDNHGGRLWAANHRDGGAVVSFALPIADERRADES